MKKLLFILFFISIYSVGQVYQPMTYNFNGTPTNGVKIKTNMPFSPGAYMPTIIIEGYNFGTSETINLMINYYIYSDASTTANWENPANFYFYTNNASSSGGYAPTIKLANENNKVVIFLDSKDYYQRFMIRAFGQGMSEQAAWFQGWTTADEALTGTKQVTVPYKNRVKGEFIVNGNTTSIGNTFFSGNTFYDNQNTIYAKNTSGSYEAVLYPRWTNNATYLDGGSGGVYLRVNNGSNEGLYINPQTNVGIGTNAPNYKLHVQGGSNNNEIARFVSQDSPSHSIGLGVDAAATYWGASIFQDGTKRFTVESSGGILVGSAYQNSNAPSNGAIIEGNVGIGTADPGIFKLAVNGNIKAKEVKVSTQNWADFVFANDYQLPLLANVETFIKENKHLPEIPSEKDVKEHGIDLGQMNAKLLQKVEELTLYLIEQSKKNDVQSEQINQLEKEVKELKSLGRK